MFTLFNVSCQKIFEFIKAVQAVQLLYIWILPGDALNQTEIRIKDGFNFRLILQTQKTKVVCKAKYFFGYK